MSKIKEFDILITNFFDYDINLASKDSIYYYAIAIKKKDNKYIVLNNELNLKAIDIIKLAKENNILIVKDQPLTRTLYLQVEPMEKIPELFTKKLDEIYNKI